MRLRPYLIVAACAAAPAHSGEPALFIGAPFGPGFSRSVPECPKAQIVEGHSVYNDRVIGASRKLCFKISESSTDAVELGGTPDLGVDYSAFAYVFDDSMTAVTLSFAEASFTKMRAALELKYGKPSSSSTESYQNRMGAMFSGEVIEWDPQGFTVMLRQRGLNLNRSAIQAFTPEYGERENQKEAAAAARAAKKF